MKRVLIVDDAAFMRMTLKTMLERHDYKIVGEAANGQEGIEKFVELSPDIVTLDITMPDMDGIQVLKEIIKINPKAKVLIISAIGQEAVVKESVVSGALGFLVKPFKEDAIIKSISIL